MGAWRSNSSVVAAEAVSLSGSAVTATADADRKVRDVPAKPAVDAAADVERAIKALAKKREEDENLTEPPESAKRTAEAENFMAASVDWLPACLDCFRKDEELTLLQLPTVAIIQKRRRRRQRGGEGRELLHFPVTELPKVMGGHEQQAEC